MSREWKCRLALGLWGITLLLVALVHGLGQRWWFTAFFVYSPQLLWPMAMLGLAALVWSTSRKLALLLLGTAFFLAGPVMEWRTHGKIHAPLAAGDPDVLRVMTCNRGQSYGHTLASFISKQQPDVLAIQDAGSPQAFVPGGPEYQSFAHRAQVGEFVLLSRHPVIGTRLVVCQATLGDQSLMSWFKGARFVVQFHDHQVAIYTVHMPSPRHELHAYRPSTLGRPQQRRRMFRFWEEQQVLDEEMLKQIEADPLPVIVLGDWNLPALGPLYRRLTRRLADAHACAGTGYGFSFPGDVWFAAAWGGRWLRLDDVLCSKEWEPLECIVEPKSESQHSPVAAVLRWR